MRSLGTRLNAVLISEVSGNLVGFALVRLNAVCPVAPQIVVELNKLYVQEHFFGKGIGRSLLSASLEVARTAGHQAIWLQVYYGSCAR